MQIAYLVTSWEKLESLLGGCGISRRIARGVLKLSENHVYLMVVSEDAIVVADDIIVVRT